MLDRLTQTHPVWLLLAVSEEEAGRMLLKQPPGVRGHRPGIHTSTHSALIIFTVVLYSVTGPSMPQVFLVRKSTALQRKVLSVRVGEDQSGTPIIHFPVRENQYST